MNKDLLPTYASICELYIGQSMQIKDIALYLSIDINHVNRALNAYLNKPENPTTITVESIINNRTAYVLHQWNRLSTKDIAEDLGVHKSTIWEICARVGINTKQKIMSNGVKMPPVETCIIFNNETGIYYINAPEAAEAYGVNKRTLNDYFIGKTKAKHWRRFEKYELN